MTLPAPGLGCGGYQAACPAGAIKKGEGIIGVIQHSLCNGMEFLHGWLRMGEAVAPPLIRQVRSHINPDKTAVIDAPPGTSCLGAFRPALISGPLLWLLPRPLPRSS